MVWTTVFASVEVQDEMGALPRDMRASFERIVGLIQSLGLQRVREPYIKHIDDKLWEMRLRGKDGIARAIYMTGSAGASSFYAYSSRKLRKRRNARSNWHGNAPKR